MANSFAEYIRTDVINPTRAFDYAIEKAEAKLPKTCIDSVSNLNIHKHINHNNGLEQALIRNRSRIPLPGGFLIYSTSTTYEAFHFEPIRTSRIFHRRSDHYFSLRLDQVYRQQWKPRNQFSRRVFVDSKI